MGDPFEILPFDLAVAFKNYHAPIVRFEFGGAKGPSTGRPETADSRSYDATIPPPFSPIAGYWPRSIGRAEWNGDGRGGFCAYDDDPAAVGFLGS